jgi:ferredoxin-NADP reductase
MKGSFYLIASFAMLSLILACGASAPAQMSAAEHASHHATPPGGAAASPMASPATQNVPPPASASSTAMPAAPAAGMGANGAPAMPAGTAVQPGAAAGGMGGEMGEMMKGMGTAPTKEIYPTLMALPDGINAEQGFAIDQLAHARMSDGTAALSAGLEKLSDAATDQNYEAMQQATEQMHEGLADFESGVAGQRVVSEGKAPRNVALDWFRREMSLASPIPSAQPYTVFGMVPIHLFTMVLLVAFALAMLAMYYFKMRRATALFGRLDPDKKPPPPGAPPPAQKRPGPASPTPPPGPAAGPPKSPEPGASPSGEKPPASPQDIQSGPEAPSSEKTPSSESKSPSPGRASLNPPGSPPSESASAGSSASVNPLPAGVDATAGTPVTANWKGQLRISSIVTETPNVKTFRLIPSSAERTLPFTYLPGQFLNVTFWIGGAKMIRSYSISSSPNEREYVELSIRREPRGAVSRHIDDLLEVGELIDVDGPVGKFVFAEKVEDSVVLLSGGVGITPMMSISRYLTERSWPGDIFFIYTCQTPADIIFANDLHELERRNPKFHLYITISKPQGTGWKGAGGRITKEWLMQIVPDLASRMVHLCGPPQMMDAIKAIFTEIGSPPGRLMTEAFGAQKPAPAAPGTAKTKGPATGPEVTFSKTNKSARIRLDLTVGDSPPKQSILELSEELSIPIDFSCRVGTCGVCKTKMTVGEVDQEVQDALSDDDKAKGIILACQAKPKGEVTVEA